MNETKKRSFALGYSYVVHSFISWMFIAFVMVSLSNVVFPGFIEKFGWDSTMLANTNTVCALIAAILGILIGQWVDAKGPKIVIVIGYFVGGINYLIMGHVPNYATFVICLFITQLCMYAYAQMTTNNLIAAWFNKKKGVVLGITTAGMPASTALLLPIYSAVSAKGGMVGGLSVMGCLLLAMGVASIFWVKNTPQEVGLTPDNLPLPEETTAKPPVRKFTFAQVAKNATVWITMINFGIMFCATIASVCQLVPYMLQHGYDATQAVAITALSAAGGIVGSFIFGLIDQKFGTKIATLVYTIIALLTYLGLFLVPSGSGLIVFLSVLAFGLNGAPGNLFPSMIITKFGGEVFSSISKLTTPVVCICRALGYSVAAAFATLFAGGMARGIYLGLVFLMAICTILTALYKKGQETIA